MLVPEHLVEAYELGALIANPGILVQLGLPEAAVTECNEQSDFV